jgi:hypothetical protein
MRVEALADAESFTHAPRHVRRLSKVAQLELQATRTNR